VHRYAAGELRHTRLTRATGAIAAALMIAGLALLLAPAERASGTPAVATPTPLPTSADRNDNADSTTDTVAVGTEPTVDSPAAGAFIGSGSTTVSGTRSPGDEIQLFVGDTGGDPACIVAAAGAHWSCPAVSLPNGTAVTLRAVVTGDAALTATTIVTALGPPSIQSGSGGVISNGLIHGTGYPGAVVTARVSGAHSAGTTCSFTADANGNWACVLDPKLADGGYSISAAQVGPTGFGNRESDSSAPLPLIFDATAPVAPTLTSPLTGSAIGADAKTVYSGAGEDRAQVTVWASTPTGSQQLCSATVNAGAWRCVGAVLTPGTYTISALQQDAAGNTSAASAAVSLRVTASVPSASAPGPSSTSSNAAVPSAPPSSFGAPGGSAGVPAAPWTAVPSPGSPPPPNAAQPPSAPMTIPLTMTPFTAAVRSVSGLDSLSTWLPAALLALIALVLLVIPARLLAGAVAGARADAGRAAAINPLLLFGRNRGRYEYDQAPALRTPPPWVTTAAAAFCATALITFAGPIATADAYFRVVPAVFLALGVVGAVAVGVPLLAARRAAGATATAAFAPYTLVLVAAASAVSRVLQLQPTLLYGVIVVVTVVTGSTAVRGKLAAMQLGSLAVLAAFGWLTLDLLPTVDSALAAFASEFVNATVLVAIGSAGVLLLPLGSLPGRAILRWSRGTWLLIAIAVETLLFAILVPIQDLATRQTGTLAFAIGTLAFAAISISAWLWQRYIAPALR